jgi:triosephosphate isomerase (TIM)
MTLRPLLAANWKMHPAPAGFDKADSAYQPHPKIDVVVFPTFLDLQACVDAELMTGAQCGHAEKDGAHTGDVSMAMIAETGAAYVLCGHSERRAFHGETDAMVRAQATAAIKAGLQPIVCVGETEEERKAGKQEEVVSRQLTDMPSGIIVAYEPVWAIGTGKTASPEDAQQMHAFIRGLLPHGAKTRILYGGSMTAETCEALLGQPDIDGGLVGGASLKPKEFAAMVACAAQLTS